MTFMPSITKAICTFVLAISLPSLAQAQAPIKTTRLV
eukprot:gene20785-40674_t